MNDQIRTEWLQAIFGAHSITKTVVGYYELLNGDHDNEDRLLKKMATICRTENINDDQLKSLRHIFDLIIDFRSNRDQFISQEQLESTRKVCQGYVNWVFT